MKKEVLKDLRIERLRQVRQQSHIRAQQQCGLYQKEKEELKLARKTDARTKKLKQTLEQTKDLENDWKNALVNTGTAHREAGHILKNAEGELRLQGKVAQIKEKRELLRYTQALAQRQDALAEYESRISRMRELLSIKKDIEAHHREEASVFAEQQRVQQQLKEQQKAGRWGPPVGSVTVAKSRVFQADLDVSNRRYVDINAKVIRHCADAVKDNTVVFNRAEAVKVDIIGALRRRVIHEMETKWRQQKRVDKAENKRTEKAKADTFSQAIAALNKVDRSPERWNRIKNSLDVAKVGTKATMELDDEGAIQSEFEDMFLRGGTAEESYPEQSYTRYSISESEPFDGFRTQRFSVARRDVQSTNRDDDGDEPHSDGEFSGSGLRSQRVDQWTDYPGSPSRKSDVMSQVNGSPSAVHAISYSEVDELVDRWISRKAKVAKGTPESARPPAPLVSAVVAESTSRSPADEALDQWASVGVWRSYEAESPLKATVVAPPEPLPLPTFPALSSATRERSLQHQEEEEQVDEEMDEDSLGPVSSASSSSGGGSIGGSVDDSSSDTDGGGMLWYENPQGEEVDAVKVPTHLSPSHATHREAEAAVVAEASTEYPVSDDRAPRSPSPVATGREGDREEDELDAAVISSPDVQPPPPPGYRDFTSTDNASMNRFLEFVSSPVPAVSPPALSFEQTVSRDKPIVDSREPAARAEASEQAIAHYSVVREIQTKASPSRIPRLAATRRQVGTPEHSPSRAQPSTHSAAAGSRRETAPAPPAHAQEVPAESKYVPPAVASSAAKPTSPAAPFPFSDSISSSSVSDQNRAEAVGVRFTVTDRHEANGRKRTFYSSESSGSDSEASMTDDSLRCGTRIISLHAPHLCRLLTEWIPRATANISSPLQVARTPPEIMFFQSRLLILAVKKLALSGPSSVQSRRRRSL
jgi:hypothetical protein